MALRFAGGGCGEEGAVVGGEGWWLFVGFAGLRVIVFKGLASRFVAWRLEHFSCLLRLG